MMIAERAAELMIHSQSVRASQELAEPVPA
jgi:hypothetical protein